MNTDSPLDRLRSKLEKILHLNGCQQRTAGYNDYIEKKDIDTDDMERLEALTLDEVMAEVELYSVAISHKQVIEELEWLKENGKWFTERGYYCFECNTLTHPDSYKSSTGRRTIPLLCSNCGQGQVTSSSHVSLEQIKRRVAELRKTL